MAYFTGITFDGGLTVGTALSFAAEIHLFLQMRRVRGAYAQLERTKETDPQREAMEGQFRTNLGIAGFLIVFSTYNSIAYVAETFHPAPGFLPAWVQIGIRGGVIPALFLLAGFLTPLTADAAVLLRSASHAMLHRTLNRALKQWNRRIDKAFGRGNDLAPIAVALMIDAGDEDGARRIQLIADGLAKVEGTATGTDPLADEGPNHTDIPMPAPYGPDSGPFPTGGGTPFGRPSQRFTAYHDDTLPGRYSGEYAPDLVPVGAPSGVAAAVQSSPWTSPEDLATQAYVNAYLDMLPLTTKKALRALLGINNRKSGTMYDVWFHQYSGQRRIEAAKRAEAEVVTVDAEPETVEAEMPIAQ
jgi:hypothetical protein